MTTGTPLEDEPEAVPARTRGQRLASVARRMPATLVIVVLMLVVGVAFGTLWHALDGTELMTRVAYGLPAFEAGRWYTVATGAFFALVPLQYLAVVGGFLVLAGFAEVRLGTARMLLAVVVGQAVAVLVAAVLLAVARGHGWPWADATAGVLDVGFSAGALGAAAAATATLRAPWRGRARFVMLAYCAVNFLYVGALWDVEHGVAVTLGLAAGPALAGRAYVRPARRLGRREWRLLAAAWTFFVAAGSVLTAFLPGDGPLADPRVDGGPEAAGWVGLVGAALLLLLADGLRRGRRVAWRWVTALAVLVVLGAVAPPYTADSIYSGILMGGLLVVLLLGRFRAHAFAVRGERGTGWKVVGLLAVVFAALCLYAWLGFSLIAGFTPAVTFESASSEVLSRILLGTSGMVEATTPLAHAFLVSLTVLWWIAFVGALLLVLWNNRRPPESSHDEVAALLRRHGGGDLSWMTTWPDNSHWFADDRDAAVAYRVHAGVAVGLADPVCAPERLGAAVAGFAAYAEASGLLPCLFSTTEETADAAGEALGWTRLQVAEEAVVPLVGLAFKGKAWQDVRTALNRAAKEGVRFELGRLDAQPFGVVVQARAISEEWVGDKGLPEMGFTLGGIDEALDPEVMVGLAIDGEGTVQGITSWLPVYGPGGVVRGWTLDVMRRRDGGFRPVVEFMIASSALAFQERGAELLSLSGAPLARSDEQEEGPLDRLLDALGEALEPYYGFRSLHAFKAKFSPEHRPMFLLVPDDAALPRVGIAIGRAYLPDAGITDLAAMARHPG